jgi:hypothetical protein
MLRLKEILKTEFESISVDPFWNTGTELGLRIAIRFSGCLGFNRGHINNSTGKWIN